MASIVSVSSFFHREGVNGNPLGEVIQRVEIAQQQVGLQPGGLTVAVTSVSGENNIPWGWGDWQTKGPAPKIKQAGGDIKISSFQRIFWGWFHHTMFFQP